LLCASGIVPSNFIAAAAQRLLGLSEKLVFEIAQIGSDVLNALGALGRILAKQVLLASTPNHHLHGRRTLILSSTRNSTDRHFDGVCIDAILNDCTTGKDCFDTRRGSLKFLVTTVSVAALKVFVHL
jgi:hypothetical protein